MGSRILVWTMMLFLLPAVTVGQEVPSALLQALYIKSDLDQFAVQVSTGIQDGFKHGLSTHTRLKQMPQSTITKLRAAMKTAFAPDRFKNQIRMAFRQKLRGEEIEEVLAWLGSAIGRKIAQLEAAAARPEHYDDLQQFQLQVQAARPLPKRLNRIRDLEAASKATEISVDVALKSQLTVAMVLVAHLPKGKEPTTKALMTAIEKFNRELIEETMERETHFFFLYTYHSLSTPELDRYIAFASSPTGVRYYDAIASGINTALTKGCDQWRGMIATILKP